MRRLIVTTLLAAAATAGLGGTAHATDPIGGPSFYECVYAGAVGTEAGVCVGSYCWDLCGPTLVVDPYCEQAHGPYLATCVLVDELYYSSR